MIVCQHLPLRWERGFFHDEGMVDGSTKSRLRIPEHSRSLVYGDNSSTTVKGGFRAEDSCSGVRPQDLVTKTDTKDGHLAETLLHESHRGRHVAWTSWTRG